MTRSRSDLAKDALGILVGALLLLTCTPSAHAAETNVARPNPEGGPTRVHVAIYLADLQNVSTSNQTFLADVVVIAEWDDPRLAGRATGRIGMPLEEVWNPRLQIVNQRGATAMLPQTVAVDANGHVRYRQRWFGPFGARMNLRQFPKDRQRFAVQLVSLGYGREDVELSADTADSKVKAGGRRGELLSLTDWDVDAPAMAPADYEVAPGTPPLAGLELHWNGRRRVTYYTVQVIVPLILIVMMGWMALWVSPTVVPARMSVCVTSMLALIAARFSFAQSLPAVSYLTRFDLFLLGSTFMLFAVIASVAAGAWFVAHNDLGKAQWLDQRMRVAFPVLFALLCLASWW